MMKTANLEFKIYGVFSTWSKVTKYTNIYFI